ncbi:MAG: hypothetical protein WCF03_02750 [Nitrososphaeraceae archaeon]
MRTASRSEVSLKASTAVSDNSNLSAVLSEFSSFGITTIVPFSDGCNEQKYGIFPLVDGIVTVPDFPAGISPVLNILFDTILFGSPEVRA